MSTKISLTLDKATTTIEMDEDIVQIDELVSLLIKPLLLGAGFHPDSVSRALGEECEDSFIPITTNHDC